MNFTCPNCDTPIETDPTTGDQVICPSCGSSFNLASGPTIVWNPTRSQRRLGKFELIDRVGVGGFGSVYKARDTELDRIVAIKVPRMITIGDGSGDSDRFLREARSAAQLRHPAIVSVH